VASGDSHWFKVIDAGTNKVVAVNTQMSYPLASAADNTTAKSMWLTAFVVTILTLRMEPPSMNYIIIVLLLIGKHMKISTYKGMH
jgi:hypothetical protein